MSEVIIQPDTATPQFGLLVTSTGAVRLIQNIPGGPVQAFGSDFSDTIVPELTTSLTAFFISTAGGNDFAIGAIGNDTIDGGDDDDIIQGGAGNDTLLGGAGNDILLAGLGNDIVRGGGGRDTIDGGSGNDNLQGGAGSDVIDGGSGDDTIAGGSGIDRLTGGSGQDKFLFDVANVRQVNNLDAIQDFNPREDTIIIGNSALPASASRSLRRGRQSFASVRKISREVQARIVYERNSGVVYYNPVNGADIALFQMQKNLNITASDFEVL